MVSQFNKDQVYTELKEREYKLTPKQVKKLFEREFIILKFDKDIARSYNFFKLSDNLRGLMKLNNKFNVRGIVQIQEIVDRLKIKTFKQIRDLSLTLNNELVLLRKVHESTMDGLGRDPKLQKETKREYLKNVAQVISQIPYLIGDDFSIKAKQEIHEHIYNELTFNKNSAPLDKYRGTMTDNKPVEDELSQHYDLILINNRLEVMSQVQEENTTDYYIEKLSEIFGVAKHELSKKSSIFGDGRGFILTRDIYRKILILVKKIRMEIPVIMYGDTGCGKTYMISYVAECILNCDYNRLVVNASTEKKDINLFMTQVLTKAMKFPDREVWAVFDEFNASPICGSLDDLFLNKQYNIELEFGGETILVNEIPKNLKILGIFNPYEIKKDTPKIGLVDEMAGSLFVHDVYQISNKLVKYAQNLGNLTQQTEEIFLNNYIKAELAKISEEDVEKYNFRELIKSQNNQALFRIIISESFEFIRNLENRSSVSCRDIYRFFKLMETIYQIKNYPKMSDFMVIILATHLCFLIRIPIYHDKHKLARIYTKKFKKAGLTFEGDFVADFDEFTNYFIQQAEQFGCIPDGTSMNQPLRENFFSCLTCISSQIPLLICGKPGTSKTLSLTIVNAVLNLDANLKAGTVFENTSKCLQFNYWGSVNTKAFDVERLFQRAIGKKNIQSDDLGNIFIKTEGKRSE